jgi:DNA-binding NarL/FixJ family response regulator
MSSSLLGVEDEVADLQLVDQLGCRQAASWSRTPSRPTCCRRCGWVARGDALLSPSATRKLITDLARRPERLPPSDQILVGLTDREREVMALVAEGLSNDEIAGRLFLSPLTSKTHVSRIMTKLNARDRAQLVVMAYESGLVTPGGRERR